MVNPEVYSRGNGYHSDGEVPYDDSAFMSNNCDRFKQVLTIPESDDMASVFAMAVFPSERKKAAAIRLYRRYIKFNDNQHLELLRMSLAATVGMHGRGRVEGVFSQIGMLAPDMFRTVAGLPRNKKRDEEKVVRGGDFRNEDKPSSNLANQ